MKNGAVWVCSFALALCACGETYYVNAARPNDDGDGLSWATAKQSIQAAINSVAWEGDSVLVTNGMYQPFMSMERLVTIQSVNGAAVTVIDGANSMPNSCCADMGLQTNTVLKGFTLRNGYSWDGGGARGGTLNDCMLTNNVADYGGGASGSTLNRCLVIANTARYGGGVSSCTLNGCTLRGNIAVNSMTPSESGGGGASSSALINCLIVGNSSSAAGGGVFHNAMSSMLSTALSNCTVVANSAPTGGGVYGTVALYNCIVWNNEAMTGENYYLVASSAPAPMAQIAGFVNSCTAPLPLGEGNISADPLFTASDKGNYRLSMLSPCTDAGTNAFVAGETDLAGVARIIGGTVDMGAYETLPLGAAVNSDNLDWTTGGDSSWFGQTTVTADSSGAAQSGAISDAQNVWLQAGTEGKGSLHFTWRVSSESGRDYLRFYADGAPGGAISGETGWQTVVFTVTNAGPHAFRWTYSKGKSGSAGEDAAWLDQVVWTPLMTDVIVSASPAEGGTVTGGGSHAVGSMVTLAATPNPGWRFDRWENNDTNPQRSLTVPEGRAVCTAYFVQNAIPLAEALDNAALSWTTDGDTVWNGWALVSAHSGGDAAQSGAVGDLESSRVQTTVTGPGTLSFWWRVSCEADYDYLNFDLDGTTLHWLTGEVGWQQVSVSVDAGIHAVAWDYWKDESQADGADAGWLDQVLWQAAPPVITLDPQDAALASGEAVTLNVTAESQSPLAYQWFGGQSGNVTKPVPGATNTTFTTPAITAGTSYWVRVTGATGVALSRTARIGIGFAVSSLADLQKIGSGTGGWTLGASYRLTADIDAAASSSWNDSGTDASVLEGFAPIGSELAPFTGIFDGRGHIVRKLTIRRSALEGVGLFGCVATNGSIQNVGVIGPNVTGYGQVGALVGRNKGLVARSYATGLISGLWSVGGVLGENNGSVAECFATGATKTGSYEVGGLAGYNDGKIRYCYALTRALGDLSYGTLVGANWGLVANSYRNKLWGEQDEAWAGQGLTVAQMRQQATYAGWTFGSTWGIQEADGTPYLRAFAEGKTAHLAATPAAVYPANANYVWSLRPVVTAAVALAECDLISARWQVARSDTFSMSFDWMGLDTDSDPTRSPVSSRLPGGLALEANQYHFWRVKVQTGYGMWSDWSQPVQFLVFDPAVRIEDGKVSLREWLDGLQADEWRPDALSSASDLFREAVELDTESDEARLYRALTTVLSLADNPELRDLLAAFGFTFDESLLTFTGLFSSVSAPLPNEAVDRLSAQVMPALQAALADLAVMPTNWTGTVAISPDAFPVDEEIYFDCGDVLAARAMLNTAKAAVEILQAYDLTVDYAKTNFTRTAPSAAALNVTLDGDESEWADVPSTVYGDAGQLEYVKLARSDTHLFLLARLAEGITPSYFSASFESRSNEKEIWFYGFTEGMEQVSGNTRLMYLGNVLEISIELDPAEQSEAFSLQEAGLYYHDVVLYGYDEGFFDDGLKPLDALLADHPACLSAVRNPGKLSEAKVSQTEALRLALASDAAIQARTDGLMHFIEFDPEQADAQSELRQRLRTMQASMAAPQRVAYPDGEQDLYLGAIFEAPYMTRSLLPHVTDAYEIIAGTFPDPTLAGLLPGMTQATWQNELSGRIPIVVANAFTLNGQVFSTGGFGLWSLTPELYAQSGTFSDSEQTSWTETTFRGPGTLTFAWAVSSKERVNTLSVYVDGVRQTGSISGEPGWGPRQLELPAGTHTVRWLYRQSDCYYGNYSSVGLDTGFLGALEWLGSGTSATTSTEVPVPYSWLEGYFTGLPAGGDYEAAALADQDGDGLLTWQEYVAGTVPTNVASALRATIAKEGSEVLIGWTPDLRPERMYTVEGKGSLSASAWAPTNAASRFFRVKVQLP